MTTTRRGDGLLAGVLVLAFTVGYSLYGIFRHRHFGSNAFDLAIFDQAIWHLSRLEVPSSKIGGYPNLFGDHFHPVIALWAPLYLLVPSAETLIVAQATLLALSTLPVLAFARSRLPTGPAWAITIAYGLFWPMQQTMAFDVHEYAFAPLVVGLAIVAADTARWRTFWTAILVLMLTKEDLIPLVGGFGLWLVTRHDVRRGLLAIAASIAAFALVLGAIVPFFSASGRYTYLSTASDLTSRPWLAPLMLVTPVVKLRTALLWLGPFVFLPLASPLIIILPVLVAERFLSKSPNHWQAIYHYSAPFAPILAMSAADGLARVGRWIAAGSSAAAASAFTRATAAVIVVLAAVLPGRQPLWRLFAPSHYHASAADRAGDAAMALIPATASVTAQNGVAPHLSHRDRIYLLSGTPLSTDYTITARHLSPWPAGDIEALLAETARRLRPTHDVIFVADGWTVWRRKGL